MQENLWGELEEFIPLQRKPRPTLQSEPEAHQTVEHFSACVYFGHTWEYFGLIGLKKCTVCGEKGYCPLCTPNPPLMSAKPYFCTKHTPLQQDCEAQ